MTVTWNDSRTAAAVAGKALVFAVVLTWFVFAVAWALQLPRVDWSLTRDVCVRVEPPEAGTCEELPTLYERVWVR